VHTLDSDTFLLMDRIPKSLAVIGGGVIGCEYASIFMALGVKVTMRRLWAFLLRRGFPATLILSRLKALWPRWQDALDGLEPAEAEAATEETEE
jgi:3-hydroxyacyl-CoA dehydrogenase